MTEITAIGSATTPSGAPLGGASHSGASVLSDMEIKLRPSMRFRDSVELSQRARILETLRALPDIRESVVEDIRGAIDSGDYSIDDKLPLAIERLLEDLA